MGWTTLSVVALDQISKWWVMQRLKIYESFPVIDGFFDLVHIRNRGMAFGLLNGPRIDFRFWFLLLASLAAIVILLIWFFKLKAGDTGTTMGISLILGGAVGNLIDRIRYREVVDFLDFYFRSYHWPAFNVADAAITAGTFLLVITLLFKRPHSG
ncbi:MAG: signal peptidase II [Desulfatiglandaceae bacterium]